MMHHGRRLPSLVVSLLLMTGFALPASADTYQTYTTPTVNGFQIGTVQPNFPTGNYSTPTDTARRFCTDQGHSGARSFTTAIRGSAYTYIIGTGGVGVWNTTGNANVTMIESVTCFTSMTEVTYTAPTVDGYPVGTVQPLYPTGNLSTAADTARRFCTDLGHAGALRFTSTVRESAYSYVAGTGGVGPWSKSGNSNATMLESITCFHSAEVAYETPKVNGFQIGTVQPNFPTANLSTPADTARRFCQDQGHAGALSFTTAIRGSAYTYIIGTGGVGPWNTTGNGNVTMIESILCITY
ncbi:hypothetical protein [Corallococcus sp. Z5C101001]|uniref:hypothetical protein n=1 Tax=Corallococcus sp. Z5C101001 TaxID=2596829 RepID=UPI00117ED071|nr:hypothetical protein [Corallococcus sp. Z5C101001]TSC31496.1 hypothetical protein FOF48_12555 [Corallococcus sp. Z5C101001]